jgi:hypothetical protein
MVFPEYEPAATAMKAEMRVEDAGARSGSGIERESQYTWYTSRPELVLPQLGLKPANNRSLTGGYD